MKFTPKNLRFLLNCYPPYIGAGVKISYLKDDWTEMHVGMSLRWYNKNAVGTHFGGSLYSMVDPHIMLLLMQILGRDYVVWDKAAKIDFIKASRKKVKAIIKISESDVNAIKMHTDSGEKYFPEFTVKIIDENNDLIASVVKTLYVKRKNR